MVVTIADVLVLGSGGLQFRRKKQKLGLEAYIKNGIHFGNGYYISKANGQYSSLGTWPAHICRYFEEE